MGKGSFLEISILQMWALRPQGCSRSVANWEQISTTFQPQYLRYAARFVNIFKIMKWARVVGNSDIVATGLTDIPHYYLLFLIIKRKAQIINFHCTIEQKKDLNVYCHLLSGTTLSRCWSAWLHLSSRGCRDVKPGQLGLKQAGN